MKFAVTGALGHIGSQLIRQLPMTFPGAEIVMVDNMMTQRYCSLFNLPNAGKYRFIEADVLNAELEKIVKGADAVFQLAAITDAAGSFKNKEQVENNNFNATVKVAEACSKVNCPMIHLSSTSVYGTQNEVVDEDCTQEELKPQSPYAHTKLKEEKFLQELGNKSKLRFVTCRFGTICGISPGMRFHTAINKFCWQAVMGEPITVWRTALHQKRPYLTLDDAMRAFIFIIKNNLFDQRIYNVLTRNMTVNDIVEMIKQHINKIEIKYVDTEIMNQLSYEVLNNRFCGRGFNFAGSIEKCIEETIKLLRPAGR
ncbi:MAG: nucleoside-diphosphate sugar epimerase [Planctomycetes bacterium GWF2_41_51]|nr:MAG: nucleoside-diphosphate sugar epimerase [Planctomycetes bacterium GWF2_41_51]HBG27365.1 nucleoside-diphosphate sugar epimerase [Phycisphaerales bacterium]